MTLCCSSICWAVLHLIDCARAAYAAKAMLAKQYETTVRANRGGKFG